MDIHTATELSYKNGVTAALSAVKDYADILIANALCSKTAHICTACPLQEECLEYAGKNGTSIQNVVSESDIVKAAIALGDLLYKGADNE